MTRYRWTHALRQVLKASLAPLGFQEVDRLCFVHNASNCIRILNFGGFSRSGAFHFTCMVGIRFPEIESRLRPDNHDQSHPTVVTPFHLLCESRDYFTWHTSNPEQLQEIAHSAVEKIRRVATPFFERFSSLDNIEEALNSAQPFRTFVITPHERVAILAAIAIQRGHIDEAKSVLARAPSEAINQDPGDLRRIEEISQRLFPRQ